MPNIRNKGHVHLLRLYDIVAGRGGEKRVPRVPNSAQRDLPPSSASMPWMAALLFLFTLAQ